MDRPSPEPKALPLDEYDIVNPTRRKPTLYVLVGAAGALLPTFGLGVIFAASRGRGALLDLMDLGLFLVIVQVVVCLFLLVLIVPASARWQTVAVRFWGVGQFFLGTIIGTGLGIGIALWALLTAR